MIGKTVTDEKGRSFLCVWAEPCQGTDGVPRVLLHWEGSCQVCSEPIGFTSPVEYRFSSFRQNCDKHRMWRKRDDGLWYAGQFQRSAVTP